MEGVQAWLSSPPGQTPDHTEETLHDSITIDSADTKTALITGGGTGIGRAAAIALASEGYEVTVAGRTASSLEESVKLVTEAGGKAKYVIADVHDEDAVRHAVEVAAGDDGRLDV